MIRAISLVILGAASFGAVYWAMSPGSNETPIPPAAQTAAPSSAANSAPAMQEVAPQPETVAVVRNVTPSNMTAAPQAAAPPERIALPAPVVPVEPKPARRERLFNPVVVSAGVIKVGDSEISLAGISATDAERNCGADTSAWPCGRLARAALRSFIRGRAIECDVPEGADSIPNPARCYVGGDDISEWLVAQGWAEADGRYDEAARGARDGKLGLFSPQRPDGQPDELAARR